MAQEWESQGQVQGASFRGIPWSSSSIWFSSMIRIQITIIILLTMKPIEIRLVGRFKFTSKIEDDHEHLLYRGVHTQTNQLLFLKGEEYKVRPNEHFLTILQEGKILQIMQGGIGIPHMHWCGQEEDYNFIVLEELDRSMAQLLKLCNNKFTKKTILMLGEDLMSILQYFHFKNFVHSQINPKNILLGAGQKQNRIYLVDFSGACRFKDPSTLQHIKEDKVGDLRMINLQFSSIRYNRGDVVSRKDDLESLLYVLLFMIKGKLPWSQVANNFKKSDLERGKHVLKMKQETAQETLFEGQPELLMLFRYTKSLKFDDKPRYIYYKNVFKQAIDKIGINDKIYDWMLVDEPLPLEDPEIYFDIIPNEAEFIKQICEELKNIEKSEAEKEMKKKININQAKSPRSNDSGKKSKERECQIY